MEITQIGDKAVQIGRRFMPAVNVQVDGFPAYVEEESPWSVGHIYPIYFELPFETGALWTVMTFGELVPDCHDHCLAGYVDGDILVEMYVDFHNEPELSIAKIYKTWDEVLDAYVRAIY